jgi:hypothetical protein
MEMISLYVNNPRSPGDKRQFSQNNKIGSVAAVTPPDGIVNGTAEIPQDMIATMIRDRGVIAIEATTAVTTRRFGQSGEKGGVTEGRSLRTGRREGMHGGRGEMTAGMRVMTGVRGGTIV